MQFFSLFIDANTCNSHAELIQCGARSSPMELICPVITKLTDFCELAGVKNVEEKENNIPKWQVI